MEKILLWTNTPLFNDRMKERNKICDSLNLIAEAYNQLGLPPLLSNEIVSLVTNTDSLIFHKMTDGGNVSLGGLDLHPEKALELLKKPVGYEALIETINNHKKEFKTHYLNQYEIKDGEVVLIDAMVNKQREDCSLFATTEEHKRRLDFANAIKAAGIKIWGENDKIPYTILSSIFTTHGVFGGVQTWDINYQSPCLH